MGVPLRLEELHRNDAAAQALSMKVASCADATHTSVHGCATARFLGLGFFFRVSGFERVSNL
nr:hypothetical protein XACG102_6600004 [Xanthomonas citri pv. citri]